MQIKIFRNENTNKKTGKKFTSYTTIMVLNGQKTYVNMAFKFDTAEKQVTGSGVADVKLSDLNLVTKNDRTTLYYNAEKIDFTEFTKKSELTADMFVTNEKETSETEISTDNNSDLPF